MNVNCGACQAYAPYVSELYSLYGSRVKSNRNNCIRN